MEVSFSSAFKRAFKKKIKGNEDLELNQILFGRN